MAVAPGAGDDRRGRADHVEFFDVGYTRILPWQRRPEAARLTAALADPDRGFEAIVIGRTSGRSTATSTP